MIDIYKKNEFFIKDNEEIVWFSIEKQGDRKYFKIPFAIITASNPMNIDSSVQDNIFENNLLENKIKSLKYTYELTVGNTDDHSEDSFIVYRLPKRLALELGREFNQYSIFYNDSRYLGYIKCDDENVILKSIVTDNGIARSYIPEYFIIDINSSAEEVINMFKEVSCICPMPGRWHTLWKKLGDDSVDKPLILSGWAYSSDEEKQSRFFEHLKFAEENNKLPSIIECMNKLGSKDWLIK